SDRKGRRHFLDFFFFFFSSRRRHTRWPRDWSSDVCSSDLPPRRLKIEVLPDGAVVGAFEILDAVDKGLVESGFAWTHYWSGKSRSEERRVGKECRSRWSTDELKEKINNR